jgi:cell division protein FtsL
MTTATRSTAASDVAFHLDPGEGRARPRLHPWIIFALAVVVAFFGLIYSRISLDQSAFVLEDLEQQIATEEARHWDLRVDVARLQSPDRITSVAQDMGMIYPAELASLEVEGVDATELDPEYRWAQLKALLTAQP